MNKFSLSLCCLLLVACSAVRAQTQYMGWLASFNTVKVGQKTSIHSDLQWRSSDNLKQMQTLLLRGGLNYHLTEKIIVTGGYAFIQNRRVINDVAGYVPEHRIWEQLILNHKQGPVSIQHRLRLEQRFLGRAAVVNDELETDGHSHANRLRYFIRNILPLRKQSPFVRGPFVALQNEVFLNIGNKNAVNGKTFDQNRFYLAMGVRLRPQVDIEAGYLNQYIKGSLSRTNNHVAQLAVYLRI